MKKKFESEEELKHYLDDNFQVKYGNTIKSDSAFVIYIMDNKGCSIISRGIYNSPIEAVRSIQEITQQTRIPVDDIDICLYGIINQVNNTYQGVDILLSPFIYFKRPEKEEEKK